jgi:hypothetical protein
MEWDPQKGLSKKISAWTNILAVATGITAWFYFSDTLDFVHEYIWPYMWPIGAAIWIFLVVAIIGQFVAGMIAWLYYRLRGE